jgi:hypothetical protein
MSPILPSWFKQRQAKAEEAAENLYRLTGPNLREAFIGIRREENGHWLAFLRYAAGGSDAAVTEPRFQTLYDAWEAAFELFRTGVVV